MKKDYLIPQSQVVFMDVEKDFLSSSQVPPRNESIDISTDETSQDANFAW